MRCSRSSVASRFVMLLVLALFVGTATVAVGQVTSGSINGTVRDSHRRRHSTRHSHRGQPVDRRRTHGHHERYR